MKLLKFWERALNCSPLLIWELLTMSKRPVIPSKTVEFLQRIALTPLNPDGIELIMMEQFRYYRLILERGYDKDRAVACMETVEAFLDAGWKALFEKILQ